VPSLRLIASALLAGVLFAAPAFADVDTARKRFEKGVELFQRGEHQAALDEFLAANAAHHDAAITYNIARARESLAQAQPAIDTYEAYIADAGEQGEFTAASTLAIAQIKARSTRLRIETTPAGARVTVDGTELRDATPVSIFLFGGKHTVEITKDDWKETRVVDLPGGGSTTDLTLVRSATPKPKPKPKPKPAPTAPVAKPAPPPEPPVLEGLIGGAALSLSGFAFVGEAEESGEQTEKESDETAKGIVFGLAFEAGWALGPRTGLVLRGFGGLGSSRSELAALAAGGPALTYRLSDDWWIGGGAIFGGSRADSDATKEERDPIAGVNRSDSSITYRTDFAVGPTVELSYALGQTGDGQWIVSLIPGMLLTTNREQSTIFIPLLIGYRWF
jgi:hypothetical protein